MDNERVVTGDEWVEFAERVMTMAREEGMLGLILAGFEDAGNGGMGMNISFMSAPSLCSHDKLGMKLKVIEKLSMVAFDAVQDESHNHDESDENGGRDRKDGFDA